MNTTTQGTPVARALRMLGAAYRGYWGDLDGRALRAELDELADYVDRPDEFDFDAWLGRSGICPTCGQWLNLICDGLHEEETQAIGVRK